MASIRKIVKVELTNEEKEILHKASNILEELAGEDGANELLDEVMDNFEEGLYFISHALDNLVENSN